MGECTEQRCEVRSKLREPLPAGVELEQSCFPAEMVDVSKSGAQFRFPECEARPDIAQGREIYSTIWLPSGKLKRFRATTRWFHQFPGGYTMGVMFLDTVDETIHLELLEKAS